MHRSSSAISTYSFGWCAWSMLPGPQITDEQPAAWKWLASVP